jgi:ribonuclease HII
MVRPTLRLERRLLRTGVQRLGGVDEVGRGSPAGPMYVGLVIVDAGTGPPPTGVRDSKLLTARAREELVPRIRAWAPECSIGMASPAEIDVLGITGALRLAGARALAVLSVSPDQLIVDGNYDWITPVHEDGGARRPAVTTKIKADLTCTSVAAASILAKVARDAVMVGLAEAFPEYGWAVNKGYGTTDHLDAIRRHGPTCHHRLSWQLPERDRKSQPPGLPDGSGERVTSAPAPWAGPAPARR